MQSIDLSAFLQLARLLQSIWHRPPDSLAAQQKAKAMTDRFTTARHYALSFVGALFVAALMVSAAVPVVPIA